jgi:uncharacterized protein
LIDKFNTSKVMTLKAVVNRGNCGEAARKTVPSSCGLMSSNSQLICAGLWQWVQSPGLERFEFSRAGDEWIFRGTILTLAHDAPAEARYEIVCDRSFKTRHANISLLDSSGERALKIDARDGRWFENGRENQAVKGAVDIDLGWSPSTNTLPIKRLKLEIGQSTGEFVAAWVRFPELTLQPLPQEYLRLAERQYRYSSRGGAFVAKIIVDNEDLVMDYEGFWLRADGNK